MEIIQKNSFLQIPSTALYDIRKIHNLEPRMIEQAVNILQAWILKQDHIIKKDFTLQVTDITEILNNSEFEDSGDDEDFVGSLITTDDRSDAAQSSEDEDLSDSDDDSNFPEARAGSSGVGRTIAGRRGRGRRRAGARVRTRGGTRSLGPTTLPKSYVRQKNNGSLHQL